MFRSCNVADGACVLHMYAPNSLFMQHFGHVFEAPILLDGLHSGCMSLLYTYDFQELGWALSQLKGLAFFFKGGSRADGSVNRF